MGTFGRTCTESSKKKKRIVDVQLGNISIQVWKFLPLKLYQPINHQKALEMKLWHTHIYTTVGELVLSRLISIQKMDEKIVMGSKSEKKEITKEEERENFHMIVANVFEV